MGLDWRSMGALLALTGCGGSELDCVAGFEPGPGDVCYEIDADEDAPEPDSGRSESADTGVAPEPPTLEDLLATLPPCVLGDPDPTGAIDIDEGCAGAGCVGMTLAALEDVWGASSCDPSVPASYVYCDWGSQDTIAYFDDVDEDGVADPDYPTPSIYVGPGFPGATPEGLVAGISIDCFVRERGLPTAFETTESDGLYWLSWFEWDDGAFWVIDYYDAEDELGGDGIVDWIYLR